MEPQPSISLGQKRASGLKSLVVLSLYPDMDFFRSMCFKGLMPDDPVGIPFTLMADFITTKESAARESPIGIML